MDEKIVGIDEARKSAEQVAQKVVGSIIEKNEDRQQQSAIESILKTMGEINPEEGDFGELSAFLELPDEQFDLLSPFVLQEMERAFNNTNDRLIMAQALNASGVKFEDYKEIFTSFIECIDKNLTMLSTSKKDFLKNWITISLNAMAETEGIPKRTIEVPIEICRDGVEMPEYAHLGDAAMDLRAAEDVVLRPGERAIVPTGIKVAIPLGYALLIQPRSGMSAKSYLRIANTPGLIDSGYRGEIGIIAENTDQWIKKPIISTDNGKLEIESFEFGNDIEISKGDRIAQARLVEVPTITWHTVEKIPENTQRGEGGFGSTGKK